MAEEVHGMKVYMMQQASVLDQCLETMNRVMDKALFDKQLVEDMKKHLERTDRMPVTTEEANEDVKR